MSQFWKSREEDKVEEERERAGDCIIPEWKKEGRLDWIHSLMRDDHLESRYDERTKQQVPLPLEDQRTSRSKDPH